MAFTMVFGDIIARSFALHILMYFFPEYIFQVNLFLTRIFYDNLTKCAHASPNYGHTPVQFMTCMNSYHIMFFLTCMLPYTSMELYDFHVFCMMVNPGYIFEK